MISLEGLALKWCSWKGTVVGWFFSYRHVYFIEHVYCTTSYSMDVYLANFLVNKCVQVSRWLGEPCATQPLRCYAKENHWDRTGQACQRLGNIWLNNRALLTRLAQTLWNHPKGVSRPQHNKQQWQQKQQATKTKTTTTTTTNSREVRGVGLNFVYWMLMKCLICRIRGIGIILNYFVTLYSEWYCMPVLLKWSIHRKPSMIFVAHQLLWQRLDK